MEIETKFELRLEAKEKDALILTSALFHQICDEIDDCNKCPLSNLCNGTRPHIVLRGLIEKASNI